MPASQRPPRVTLAIATYKGERYLAEAIESCLGQDYADFELLVVEDASPDGSARIIERYLGDPRLRVVTHPENRGIAAAYNSIWREARGELIARLGHDDIALPDRLSRQVAVFDRHPDTGVVHGEGVIIDEHGRPTGSWGSRDLGRRALLDQLVRHHNFLLDPSTMVHRRVYEAIGGYSGDYPMCNDFDLWLRAARRFRFRHTPGGPVIRYRRHGGNFSDESAREREVDEVTRALRSAVDSFPLRELVPELDWSGLEPRAAERRALLLLAEAFDRRLLPLPALAAELRARAGAIAVPAPRPRHGRSIMLTCFGWNDSGGGTIVPRYVARELSRRGWDVTVFHAAVGRTESAAPYELREWEEDGVRLIGVHNRPHGLFDHGHPHREIDDPPITRAFAAALDRLRPDVIHFHNLHNLGAALIDQAAARGIPSYFSTHNYWLVCPRAYLFRADGSLCAGPGDGGGDCAACVGSADRVGHRHRLSEIRSRFGRGVNACLAVSEAVRETLVNAGYPREMIDVVRQGLPEIDAIWEQLGRERRPGRAGGPLTVAFFGSAYPHKGPQLLVEAAQAVAADLRVLIHGEVPEAFAARLRALDTRGLVELAGPFAHHELPSLLAEVDVAALPSIWWDCAPLALSEAQAGRVAVVAARMGGMADAVRHEHDGLLFDGRDAADLARQLERLANEEGLLERLQANVEAPRPFAAYVNELERYYAGERPARDDGPRRPAAVRWIGDHGRATSLSTINQNVVRELRRAGGLELERVERDGRSLDPPLPHTASVEVRHQWPPDLRPAASGRLALIQPWEFGAVPVEWLAPLHGNVDELWVPSAYVRDMYLRAGVAPERVAVLPNGVDLDRFRPDGPRLELDAPEGLRLLFVGGLIARKGPDLLLAAYERAFAGRDDVTLVVKDFGADGIYAGDRSALREWARSRRLPRLLYLHDELSSDELAALYRACDVLVHPYRGEGFAMPVLEAMACGLPAIVTAGGPTDEFCPPEAGWRIRSRRVELAEEGIDSLRTAGRPWLLEPDAGHLAELMLAAVDGAERRRRGRAAAVAARRYGWDAVARSYRERIEALAARPPRSAAPAEGALPVAGTAASKLLATPAWRGGDRLAELLSAWAASVSAGDGACLYLLADPRHDGEPAQLEAHVMAAAGRAGVDLERSGDVTVIVQPLYGDEDARLHRAFDAYVPLHDACAGHRRLAEAAGSALLEPRAEAIAAWLAGRHATRAA